MVDLQMMGGTAMTIMLVIGLIIIIGSVLGFITWYFLQKKKYSEFLCEIYEKDGLGNTISYYDNAGIFVDSKTKNKRLFLKNANVGLNADNVPYIMRKSGKGYTKVVKLFRFGLKNFSYINFKVGQDFVVTCGEEDVNWGLNSYERAKKLFSQSLLMQLLPYIALAFVSIVILIIFIYFFKDFAVLKDVAVYLKEAAVALAEAKTGTVVVQP